MGNKGSASGGESKAGGAAAAVDAPSPEELAGMKPAGRKGWDFRVQAGKKLASRSPFGRETRLESAAELAGKAATQFKAYAECLTYNDMQVPQCKTQQAAFEAAYYSAS